ncbi:hypothetical protein WJX84_010767 [Apatococcus fuscideae]|uniref:Uncharacterized protein n=1 Tax=Apatococcus fuscideae TaxID=2026836 RepID=A0AAW1SW71_9CHLO
MLASVERIAKAESSLESRPESMEMYLEDQRSQLEAERQQLRASQRQLEADTAAGQAQLQEARSQLAADRAALMQLASTLMQSVEDARGSAEHYQAMLAPSSSLLAAEKPDVPDSQSPNHLGAFGSPHCLGSLPLEAGNELGQGTSAAGPQHASQERHAAEQASAPPQSSDAPFKKAGTAGSSHACHALRTAQQAAPSAQLANAPFTLQEGLLDEPSPMLHDPSEELPAAQQAATSGPSRPPPVNGAQTSEPVMQGPRAWWHNGFGNRAAAQVPTSSPDADIEPNFGPPCDARDGSSCLETSQALQRAGKGCAPSRANGDSQEPAPEQAWLPASSGMPPISTLLQPPQLDRLPSIGALLAPPSTQCPPLAAHMAQGAAQAGDWSKNAGGHLGNHTDGGVAASGQAGAASGSAPRAPASSSSHVAEWLAETVASAAELRIAPKDPKQPQKSKRKPFAADTGPTTRGDPGSRPNGVRAAGGQMEVQQVKKKKKRKKSAADEATRLKQKEAALAVLNRGPPSARQSRPAAAQPLLDEPFDPADYSGDDAAFETRKRKLEKGQRKPKPSMGSGCAAFPGSAPAWSSQARSQQPGPWQAGNHNPRAWVQNGQAHWESSPQHDNLAHQSTREGVRMHLEDGWSVRGSSPTWQPAKRGPEDAWQDSGSSPTKKTPKPGVFQRRLPIRPKRPGLGHEDLDAAVASLTTLPDEAIPALPPSAERQEQSARAQAAAIAALKNDAPALLEEMRQQNMLTALQLLQPDAATASDAPNANSTSASAKSLYNRMHDILDKVCEAQVGWSNPARRSMLGEAAAGPASDGETGPSMSTAAARYCLDSLRILLDCTRAFEGANSWGWSREIQAFVFIFEGANRIAVEKPEYGFATYFFEIENGLSIAAQVCRLLAVLSVKGVTRGHLNGDNSSLSISERLSAEDTTVLHACGWDPAEGIKRLLNFSDERVRHDTKADSTSSLGRDYRSRILSLLQAGRLQGRFERRPNPVPQSNHAPPQSAP